MVNAYIVETPFGTVTRTTNRDYAYVVVGSGPRFDGIGIWADRGRNGVWTSRHYLARTQALKMEKYFHDVRIVEVAPQCDANIEAAR
jgi:hypothetical protein